MVDDVDGNYDDDEGGKKKIVSPTLKPRLPDRGSERSILAVIDTFNQLLLNLW